MKDFSVTGSLAVRDRDIEIIVDRLLFSTPRLALSRTLSYRDTLSRYVVVVQGKDIEMSSLRKTVLSLAGDIPAVKDLSDLVKTGTAEYDQFRIRGIHYRGSRLGRASRRQGTVAEKRG